MNLSSDELNTELQIIYERCARLFYFAVTNDLIAHDVFVCGINRMIDEEKFLSRDPNSLLLDGLEQFKSSYEKQMNDQQCADFHKKKFPKFLNLLQQYITQTLIQNNIIQEISSKFLNETRKL